MISARAFASELGVLRMALLALAAILALVATDPGVPLNLHGFALIRTLVLPAAAPLVFFVLLFDILMSSVRLSDALPEAEGGSQRGPVPAGVEEAGWRLGHHNLLDFTPAHPDIHRQHPGAALLVDPEDAGSELPQPLTEAEFSPLRQREERAHDRVAGERELRVRREDAEAAQRLDIRGWQDECRLGEVHLRRDPLHLLVGEPFGVGEDCQRIAGEHPVGEDVRLPEAVSAHGVGRVYLRQEGVGAAPAWNSASRRAS